MVTLRGGVFSELKIFHCAFVGSSVGDACALKTIP